MPLGSGDHQVRRGVTEVAGVGPVDPQSTVTDAAAGAETGVDARERDWVGRVVALHRGSHASTLRAGPKRATGV